MRALSWLAVSCGTLTGSALAITGSPQSRATPAATAAHRRMIWIFTQDPRQSVTDGQDGQMIHFAQIPNNGTITTGSRQVRRSAQKHFAPLVRRPSPGLGSE